MGLSVPVLTINGIVFASPLFIGHLSVKVGVHVDRRAGVVPAATTVQLTFLFEPMTPAQAASAYLAKGDATQGTLHVSAGDCVTSS